MLKTFPLCLYFSFEPAADQAKQTHGLKTSWTDLARKFKADNVEC